MKTRNTSEIPRITPPGRACVGRGALFSLSIAAATVSGCLERPVGMQTPATSNQFVDTVPHSVVDKIDLLFMVDSSMSMADKQLIMRNAVPVLLRRLITPDCLDAAEARTGQRAVGGVCPAGSHPEFRPIQDIHVGVITSSLGATGGTGCSADDLGQLVPTVPQMGRPALDSWDSRGFLAWDPEGDKNTPAGENDLETLIAGFRDHIVGAGESGCGFEASLEAWYRFLIDPEPPLSITLEPAPSNPDARVAKRGPTNTALLAQRAAFLRPDSLLAIVMLSDENDCSIVDTDGTQGFRATNTRDRLDRASSACATDPNSACCHTCAADAPPGCPSNAEDPECQKGALTRIEDDANLRCFNQKQRFGMDLLHPIDRYLRGLREPTVPNRAGELVENPIYAAPPGMPRRDPGMVFLAGIVGVPWQDIATDESLSGTHLSYLNASELATKGRWDVILGDRAKNVPPTDPLMRESVDPREGVHPITGDALAPATATGLVNPINGHEQNVKERDELQYACIFPLPEARDCALESSATCDCTADKKDYNRPLCSYDRVGEPAGIQHSAKAFPGLRQLELLKGIGDQGIVASICPRYATATPNVEPEDDPNYGYNPAVTTIVDNIKRQLIDRCLPRRLSPEISEGLSQPGRVPCLAVEASQPPADGACTCEGAGRGPLSTEHEVARRAVIDEMKLDGQCGGATAIDCNSLCLCELEQLEGAELGACREGTEALETHGYCYVDPEQGLGSERLVAECRATERRKIRFVGEGLPKNRSVVTIACLGASLAEDRVQ